MQVLGNTAVEGEATEGREERGVDTLEDPGIQEGVPVNIPEGVEEDILDWVAVTLPSLDQDPGPMRKSHGVEGAISAAEELVEIAGARQVAGTERGVEEGRTRERRIPRRDAATARTRYGLIRRNYDAPSAKGKND